MTMVAWLPTATLAPTTPLPMAPPSLAMSVTVLARHVLQWVSHQRQLVKYYTGPVTVEILMNYVLFTF